MDGHALASWMRRHTEAERLLAALDATDVALAMATWHVQHEQQDAGAADVRAWIKARRSA